MTSEDSAGRIKSAASQLVKGGTLTSVACLKCGGVQVRFADKTTCINCGNETKTSAPEGEPEKLPAQGATGPGSVASIIQEKVSILALEIRSETDISLLKQKAELLETYLRILEKTKSLMD